MTLIIAHRDGWMAADRRETFESNLLGPYRVAKIKRGKGILVASAGAGVFQDLITEALELINVDPLRCVVQVFRDKGKDLGGHALALTSKGICEITSRGSVSWLDADYWAIGSGYMIALGYFAGISQGDSAKVTPETAKHAINVAERYVADVGDGYQVEHLG